MIIYNYWDSENRRCQICSLTVLRLGISISMPLAECKNEVSASYLELAFS